LEGFLNALNETANLALMSMDLDYLVSSKERHTLASLERVSGWDVFVSTLNDSERVRAVFPRVPAKEKHWLIAKEYGYADAEIPTGGAAFRLDSFNEADSIGTYMAAAHIDWPKKSLCIDITGFMRPHILFLLNFLRRAGIEAFDVLYSEPRMYRSKERTRFYSGDIVEVRQVAGFEGAHLPNIADDVLIIGAGYDHELAAQIATYKESAKVLHLYCLPSLSADMYQESVLRMAGASAASEGRAFESGIAYTAANDPFVTAAVLKETYRTAKAKHSIGNLYLSPLGTKPQTLGFALFYLRELASQPASILFPFTENANRDSSVGLANIWLYRVEF
jgi:hypothetical protein